MKLKDMKMYISRDQAEWPTDPINVHNKKMSFEDGLAVHSTYSFCLDNFYNFMGIHLDCGEQIFLNIPEKDLRKYIRKV